MAMDRQADGGPNIPANEAETLAEGKTGLDRRHFLKTAAAAAGASAVAAASHAVAADAKIGRAHV